MAAAIHVIPGISSIGDSGICAGVGYGCHTRHGWRIDIHIIDQMAFAGGVGLPDFIDQSKAGNLDRYLNAADAELIT